MVCLFPICFRFLRFVQASQSVVLRLLTILFIGSIVLGQGNIISENSFTAYDEVLASTDKLITIVPVAGGLFNMGSPEDEAERRKDEGPVHAVRLSDFWISTLEIPWDVYELFVYRNADSPAENQAEATLEIDGISGATMPYVNYNKPGYPAINITQYAASQFCKWLTAKTGHYYRLPTEAEWEYACRAGSEDAFYFGTTSKSIASYALYKGNSDGKLHKGGMKEPNALGLYDMHGNVAEWVIDRYDQNGYPHHTDMVTDPFQLGEELYPRVVRGGSYKDKPARLRSAARGYSKTSWKKRDPQSPKSLWWHTDAIHVGFRIVRPTALPAQSELTKYWIEPIKEY